MDDETSPHDSLLKAIALVGSQSAMARLCKVSQPAVAYWVKGRKELPHPHVLTVEARTGIAKERLRPDIYPPDAAAKTPAPDPVFASIEPAR